MPPVRQSARSADEQRLVVERVGQPVGRDAGRVAADGQQRHEVVRRDRSARAWPVTHPAPAPGAGGRGRRPRRGGHRCPRSSGIARSARLASAWSRRGPPSAPRMTIAGGPPARVPRARPARCPTRPCRTARARPGRPAAARAARSQPRRASRRRPPSGRCGSPAAGVAGATVGGDDERLGAQASRARRQSIAARDRRRRRRGRWPGDRLHGVGC